MEGPRRRTLVEWVQFFWAGRRGRSLNARPTPLARLHAQHGDSVALLTKLKIKLDDSIALLTKLRVKLCDSIALLTELKVKFWDGVALFHRVEG